jgi:hypothetical protein
MTELVGRRRREFAPSGSAPRAIMLIQAPLREQAKTRARQARESTGCNIGQTNDDYGFFQ